MDVPSRLMGEDVEARRKFIEENALDVKNSFRLGSARLPNLAGKVDSAAVN